MNKGFKLERKDNTVKRFKTPRKNFKNLHNNKEQQWKNNLRNIIRKHDIKGWWIPEGICFMFYEKLATLLVKTQMNLC